MHLVAGFRGSFLQESRCLVLMLLDTVNHWRIFLACRRKAREQKAYAKQVQAEKVKERAQDKKRQITQVQQLRKQREKSVSSAALHPVCSMGCISVFSVCFKTCCAVYVLYALRKACQMSCWVTQPLAPQYVFLWQKVAMVCCI